jgi:hypothetical protein
MSMSSRLATIGHAMIIRMRWRRNAGFALAFIAADLFSGCHTSDRTWSQELRSPDGQHVVIGRSDVYGGFGTDASQTTVDLNWTTGSQNPVNILVIPDAPADGKQRSLIKMKWLSPTSLEITYNGHEPPLFQALRCYGVDITLQTVPEKAADVRH